MTKSHKLGVTVRLDIELRAARMEVRGCLTEENCRALVAVVDRTLRVLQVPMVVIDASGAQHIEREGVDALNLSGILGPTAHPRHAERTGTCSLIVPEVLPPCPSRFPRPHGSHRARSGVQRPATTQSPSPSGAQHDR
ncbi:hypothetical protein [Arthrobacter agilis]|jgi:hypothetical protein|uniref:hypothetical protein n=1 Tax=Arthrobacter agilis TaxID=37921 RepID=UPI00278B93CA|nr:hypothetical protein [Arthrobacter agilis]MDQ0735230.1 hypothetical protein [Arthrobacter agilis]